MGDGARDPRGRGRDASSGRSIWSSPRRGDKPASVFTRSLVVIEQGRARHAGREPRGPPAATPGQHRARARGRRRRPCRPHQDHRRGAADAARFVADGRDRRARALQRFLPSTSAAAWCATSCSSASTARARSPASAARRLLKGKQHVDTTLVVDHTAGGCQSREVFKSVLDGESRGVFQGKIIVRPHAQKTDAKMMTQALLLSDDAEADNKPELEIFADDVQCGHGATAGRARRGSAVLSDGARHPAKEAEALLIAGLRRRGDRGHRARRPARRADGARRRPGSRRGRELTRCIPR